MDLFKEYKSTHDKLIDEFGLTEKALWGSRESQQKRFATILKLMQQKEDFSILDLGCGLCDLYPYLKENGFSNFTYCGVDFHPVFIEKASKLYPEICVINGSIKEIVSLNKEWDYIVASGIYNLGLDALSSSDVFFDQFQQLFPIIKKGFAVNFLSSFSPNPNPNSVYHEPSYILNRCKETFGSAIILDHSYLPHDFTIFVYKSL